MNDDYPIIIQTPEGENWWETEECTKQLLDATTTRARGMMEWISVKDRLPAEDEPVWIYWRDREVVIGWKTHTLGLPHEHWYSYHGGDKERWTHWWMPIDIKTRPKFPSEGL